MLLELHILQNFAPSNLNRDDTGSPKACEFGGYRRARISSQAIKRAIRREFDVSNLVPAEQRAIRSKRFISEVTDALVRDGRDPMESASVVNGVIEALGLKTASDKNAEYLATVGSGDGQAELSFHKLQVLLYLSASEVATLKKFCEANWDALVAMMATEGASARDKKAAREAAKEALSKKSIDELKTALDGGRAADLALFGRMLADLPERNIDAACQVAHAISTHQVSSEFDYYTAIDDLKPDDTAGADMIGTVEFNSACYYRYANIDLVQLTRNLGGDVALAADTVRAFLVASRDAIPTGKQNSFAARNAPSFIMTVVRPSGAWSLANAFVSPVRPSGQGIIANSIAALDRHWGELTTVYGAPAGASLALVATGEADLSNLAAARLATFNDLLERTVAAVAGRS
jgi:CRISPR system Cascade subunit CasC